mmetsp:Transcript_20322/g.33443  ORF Transcript_20322/g.33443 Transcript_20322/m.33443 type:complete len:204 (-) Transcript_20322:32-643(-)
MTRMLGWESRSQSSSPLECSQRNSSCNSSIRVFTRAAISSLKLPQRPLLLPIAMMVTSPALLPVFLFLSRGGLTNVPDTLASRSNPRSVPCTWEENGWFANIARFAPASFDMAMNRIAFVILWIFSIDFFRSCNDFSVALVATGRCVLHETIGALVYCDPYSLSPGLLPIWQFRSWIALFGLGAKRCWEDAMKAVVRSGWELS